MGRKAIYGSGAERQKAYRQRHKAVKAIRGAGRMRDKREVEDDTGATGHGSTFSDLKGSVHTDKKFGNLATQQAAIQEEFKDLKANDGRRNSKMIRLLKQAIVDLDKHKGELSERSYNNQLDHLKNLIAKRESK